MRPHATRPTPDEVNLAMAQAISTRATCCKAQVGCIFVDAHNRLLSSGYNGPGRGMPHCTEHPCAGADAPRGSDLCEAVHAEENALIWCKDPDAVHTVVVTTSPCMRCAKGLIQTGIKRLVYKHEYLEEPQARLLLERRGVKYVKIVNSSLALMTRQGWQQLRHMYEG